MKIIAQYVWGSLDYYGAEIDKYTEHLLNSILVWQNIKYAHSYVCSFRYRFCSLMVKHLTVNQGIVGSSPAWSAKYNVGFPSGNGMNYSK